MTSAYTHNGDAQLMSSLGLKTDDFRREKTYLGTIHLENGRKKPKPEVRVFVTALPAQFWEFQIWRPRDEWDDDKKVPIYEPFEHFILRTGTGGFSEFWPMARRIAYHLIDISVGP